VCEAAKIPDQQQTDLSAVHAARLFVLSDYHIGCRGKQWVPQLNRAAAGITQGGS
jgi:hypothetical protein